MADRDPAVPSQQTNTRRRSRWRRFYRSDVSTVDSRQERDLGAEFTYWLPLCKGGVRLLKRYRIMMILWRTTIEYVDLRASLLRDEDPDTEFLITLDEKIIQMAKTTRTCIRGYEIHRAQAKECFCARAGVSMEDLDAFGTEKERYRAEIAPERRRFIQTYVAMPSIDEIIEALAVDLLTPISTASSSSAAGSNSPCSGRLPTVVECESEDEDHHAPINSDPETKLSADETTTCTRSDSISSESSTIQSVAHVSSHPTIDAGADVVAAPGSSQSSSPSLITGLLPLLNLDPAAPPPVVHPVPPASIRLVRRHSTRGDHYAAGITFFGPYASSAGGAEAEVASDSHHSSSHALTTDPQSREAADSVHRESVADVSSLESDVLTASEHPDPASFALPSYSALSDASASATVTTDSSIDNLDDQASD